MTDRTIEEHDQVIDGKFYGAIRGGNVLEYGPGTEETFANHCIERGARYVVCISASYFNVERYHRRIARQIMQKTTVISQLIKKIRGPKGEILRIADDGAHITLAANSFDRIVALWSLPYYGRNMTECKQLLRRMMTMLKPGGIAIICPLMVGGASPGPEFITEEKLIPILEASVFKTEGFDFHVDKVKIGRDDPKSRLIITKVK